MPQRSTPVVPAREKMRCGALPLCESPKAVVAPPARQTGGGRQGATLGAARQASTEDARAHSSPEANACIPDRHSAGTDACPTPLLCLATAPCRHTQALSSAHPSTMATSRVGPRVTMRTNAVRHHTEICTEGAQKQVPASTFDRRGRDSPQAVLLLLMSSHAGAAAPTLAPRPRLRHPRRQRTPIMLASCPTAMHVR